MYTMKSSMFLDENGFKNHILKALPEQIETAREFLTNEIRKWGSWNGAQAVRNKSPIAQFAVDIDTAKRRLSKLEKESREGNAKLNEMKKKSEEQAEKNKIPSKIMSVEELMIEIKKSPTSLTSGQMRENQDGSQSLRLMGGRVVEKNKNGQDVFVETGEKISDYISKWREASAQLVAQKEKKEKEFMQKIYA